MGLVTLAVLLFLGYSAWRLLSDKDAARRKKFLNTLLGYGATLALSLVAFRSGMPWLVGAIVFAFLVARVGNLKQAFSGKPARHAAPDPARMTRKRALQILDIQEGASEKEINDRYRELMRRVHPDQGGSAYLATELNEAKRVLLQRPE
jgi:hypothetical protein